MRGREKREKRENRIENLGKFFKGAGANLKKAAAPMTGFFDSLKRFLFFTILGAIAGSFFGRLYHRIVDATLSKIPGLNSIYNTVKQIIDTFATTQSNAFKEVVLIEYPQKDIYALAFLTSETKGEIAVRKNKKMINVFMPSTPNPTTGFLMFVPLSKCTKLSMSVDQAIKYIISAGLVTPSAPAIKKALPKTKKKLTKK